MTPDISPSGPRLSVYVVPVGQWLTVELCGELDRFHVPALLGRASALIAQEIPPRIALDLSRVAFCDSEGLNAFVRLWKRAAAASGELVLLRPPPRLAASLDRTGLDRHIRVRDTLPAASDGLP
ncbi:STAS domain-containing protein [Actinomadura syzygii]|nr:STAS domain-containing protein [Actinomadura syzygii]